jgi:hypothetical protein
MTTEWGFSNMRALLQMRWPAGDLQTFSRVYNFFTHPQHSAESINVKTNETEDEKGDADDNDLISAP